MENTSKTMQPQEAPQEPQPLPAPVPPQTVPVPPTEGPHIQDAQAQAEQALPAQDEPEGPHPDELSDSSAPGEWEEPEDPHPPEKRPRRSSPDYDPAEERSKTYVRRRKRTRRIMDSSAAPHRKPQEAQTTTGPSESETEPQQKEGRRNKMPTKVHVVEEVNASGVPVKPAKIQEPATHACGCLTREAIRIIHDDWCKVPKADKDYIWENWIKWFRVPRGSEPDVQKWLMKTANKCFKDWKSDLNIQYVQQGRSPLRRWGMITPDDWAAFVSKKTTEAAKLLSKHRSDQAKKNVHPHTLGSSGYAGKIPVWQKEIDDAVSAGKEVPYANLDERSKNWILARRTTSSSGGQISFNTPETQQVVQKITEIQAQVTQGSFVPDRENDILTQALGNKEHLGRTRGIGSKVPWKMGFPQDLYRYKSRRNVEQRRLEEYKAAFEQIYEEKKRKEQEEQEALVSPTVRSSAGSVDQAEPFGKFPVDSITGPTRCKLYVPVAKGSFKIEVASGMVYPERLWHGKPVPPAYIRVTADVVHENAKDCKLDFPTPDTEIDTLGAAKNEFILWPRRDISLEGHVPRQIIKYTSEMPVAVQGWVAATKGKKLKQPTKSQKGKTKGRTLIEVPNHFVLSKPFLSEADMAEKTMSMKRFHAWYLKACSLGLTHVLARVPPECFQLGEQVIFIEFRLMWEFFHLEKLDNELLRLWCL